MQPPLLQRPPSPKSKEWGERVGGGYLCRYQVQSLHTVVAACVRGRGGGVHGITEEGPHGSAGRLAERGVPASLSLLRATGKRRHPPAPAPSQGQSLWVVWCCETSVPAQPRRSTGCTWMRMCLLGFSWGGVLSPSCLPPCPVCGLNVCVPFGARMLHPLAVGLSLLAALGHWGGPPPRVR